MTAINRSSILKGPGTFEYDGVVLYDKDNIEAAVDLSRFDVETSVHGKADERTDDIIGKITLTPAGELSAADLAMLYPHQNPVIGSSLFGATDTAAIVHSVAGTELTFHSAALTKMPDLILSAKQTLFGKAEFSCVVKNNTVRLTANSFYTIAAVAFSDASFASANVKTDVYTAAWAGIFASIITEEGWTITTDMAMKEQQTDDLGTVDMFLEGVDVMARCVPVNLTEADIMDAMRLQGVGSTRGTSLRQGADLVIAGPAAGSLRCTIKDAALVVGPLKWGKTELRDGEIAFVGQRTEAAGAFSDLFVLEIIV